ncbi:MULTISPECIES: MFS transporter [Mycobacteriaceae]|uniref:MFS transporter n=1 Tax=Mycolicibacterium parafortuitum TaxID=39692 RepID=A0ACC6ME22_MYCPF|nr:MULTISPECIES: MFS transporter [Mycobacteriaceae]MDZ5084846.1 MFS transporter [Mycolicibacterium parafortuitum]GFM18568.1 arabinose efflux permease family protein [Mycobacterium sp. PO1]GFM26547.1 arabinose efflux permease family protein [Mycobacterium sp. PO2]
MTLSAGGRIGLAGAAVVGVAFGMARYAYGVTLPDIRADLGLSELVLGLIASATFVGYLAGLLLAGPLAARRGSRAPTTVGGVCGAVGAVIVALAPSPWLLALGAVLAGGAGGWVWAPYSDIVTRTVTLRQQPRALAIITTGTSGGLVVLGGLAILAIVGSWRLVWVAIAVAAVLAALVNLRLVPRTAPVPAAKRSAGGPSLAVALRVPAAYSVVYFAAVVIYFTYAADVLDRGSLPEWAVPALYIAIGLTGVVGVATGTAAQRLGSARVAALCLVIVAGALVLLGLASESLAAVAISACIFGVGYMTGSAVLAVWTAELVPERAGAAFTACLVVGAVSSVAAPAVAGAVIPGLGLGTVLVITAAVSLGSGVVLMLPSVHDAARG